MEKKAQAKSEMLKNLSSAMSDDTNAPLKEMLGKKGMKGMKKVSVMSDSEEGLKKGLTMAEKIMKAKSEKSGESDDSYEEDMEDESMEPSDHHMDEMSEEEMLDMYEMLKQKLGK
jgi:hypothetical protein